MARLERQDWVVCGRAIGSATGWDQSDTFGLMLYNFKPAPGYSGPIGKTVVFHFEHGTVESIKRTGEVKESADLIDSIKDAPRARAD